MKVKDLLCDGCYLVDLKPLQAKNLRSICKLGLHPSLIRLKSNGKPYCTVCSPCAGIDNCFNHICIFPIRDSMSICTVVNRVLAVIDNMGYLKHVKK